MGGMVELKFKNHYKLQMAIHQTKLGNLRTELFHTQKLMNPELFNLLKANSLLKKLPKPLRELWNNTMVALEEAMDTRVMTTEEAA